jgi:O-antigen biosynthesis protein
VDAAAVDIEGLRAWLTREPERRLEAGRGNVLLVEGEWQPSGAATPQLTLGPLRAERVDRVPGAVPKREQFSALLDVPAGTAPGPYRLQLSATGDSAPEAVADLGEIVIGPDASVAPPPISVGVADAAPLIAVCMATWEPDPAAFEAQVSSLREQSWRDWVCVISDDGSGPEARAAMARVIGDDERFVLSASPVRRGFYRNFERALRMAPAEATYVALCDQDDRWHPDKLSALHNALVARPAAQLAYSDMRICDPEGRVLSETFWLDRRRPGHEHLDAVLVSNSVTGAAAMFRAGLLHDALPFPAAIGSAYHDHWLALCALATGEIAYVDRPLYDRVRHPASVTADTAHARRVESLRRAATGGEDGSGEEVEGPRPVTPSKRQKGRSPLEEALLQRLLFARVLELRAGGGMPARKRRELRSLAAADRSALGLLRLGVRALRRRPESQGRERAMLAAVAQRRLRRVRRLLAARRAAHRS